MYVLGECVLMVDIIFQFLYVFDAVTYGIPFLLVTIFSAFPYAISIQDDEKNGYMYLLISRGNIISYTFSKCCVISISSILTIVLGVLCFVVMCKMGITLDCR